MLLWSIETIAEHPVVVVPVVELCLPAAEDKRDPERYDDRECEEESFVTGSHSDDVGRTIGGMLRAIRTYMSKLRRKLN